MVATLDPAPGRAADDRVGFDKMATLLRYFAGWLAPRREKVQVSYLIPERGGFGWYVVAKEPAFDFALSHELAAFGADLLRSGFAVHAVLLPGSVSATVPADAIAISPGGQVSTHAG